MSESVRRRTIPTTKTILIEVVLNAISEATAPMNNKVMIRFIISPLVMWSPTKKVRANAQA